MIMDYLHNDASLGDSFKIEERPYAADAKRLDSDVTVSVNLALDEI